MRKWLKKPYRWDLNISVWKHSEEWSISTFQSSLSGCGGRTAGNHPALLHQDMEELVVQHQVNCSPTFDLGKKNISERWCEEKQWFCVSSFLAWHAWNDTTLMMNKLLFQSMACQQCHLCLLHSDWCISRQLWWGHQVPAYQVELPNPTDRHEVCEHVRPFSQCNPKHKL